MQSSRGGRERVSEAGGRCATINRQTKNFEGRKSVTGQTTERFRKLAEGWRNEDPAYDREAWPELKEALDRNRPEYRKHFPGEYDERSKAAEG